MDFVNDDLLYKLCLETWGLDDQFGMASEECGELITAMNQYKRNRVELSKVMEEAADVFLMANQIGSLDKELFMYYIKIKREHTINLLKEDGVDYG